MMGDKQARVLSPEWVKDWWMGERIACPPHLTAPLANALAERHYSEGKFLAVMGLVVGVISLLVDALVNPGDFAKVAAARLIPTVPLQLWALSMPRERLGMQKFLIGMSLCVFGASLIYASSLAPAGPAIVMALGPVILLGAALPLLPFIGVQVFIFTAGFVLSIAIASLLFSLEANFASSLILILVIVGVGAAVISLRLRVVERQGMLATLLAEARARELENSNERLRQLSMQDPLTDLANRRWVETAFERDYAHSKQKVPGYPCVFLLDLDHFKAFNDRWGHAAGDDCLLAVARVLQHVAETHGGIAARFGGEEFVLLARIENLAQAQTIAEQVRVAVERIEVAYGTAGQTATCTTSIGVAIHEASSPPVLTELLKKADEALYRAKNDGRNRFRLAG